MKSFLHQLLRWLWTTVCAVILLACAIVAIRTWMASQAIEQAQSAPLSTKAESLLLQKAMRLRPDLSQPWRLQAENLSFSHPRAARALVWRAVQLNRDNWHNWYNLGMLDYQLGHIHAAQRDLGYAARDDNGFSAHFASANLAFLLGEKRRFWQQMKIALRIAPDEYVLPAMQDLTHLASRHPRRIIAALPPHRVGFTVAAISYFTQQNRLRFATQLWNSLACPNYLHSFCRQAALTLVRAWRLRALAIETSHSTLQSKPGHSRAPVAGGDHQPTSSYPAVRQMLAVWNQAVASRILPGPPAAMGQLRDGGLRLPWLGGLLWQGSSSPVTMLPGTDDGGNAVQLRFSGDQPSHEILLTQWLALRPGRTYRLSFQTQGWNLHHPYGLTIRFQGSAGVRGVNFTVAHLDSHWTSHAVDFLCPPRAFIYQLQIRYDRPLGRQLLRGSVSLEHFSLRTLPFDSPVQVNAQHGHAF